MALPEATAETGPMLVSVTEVIIRWCDSPHRHFCSLDNSEINLQRGVVALVGERSATRTVQDCNGCFNPSRATIFTIVKAGIGARWGTGRCGY